MPAEHPENGAYNPALPFAARGGKPFLPMGKCAFILCCLFGLAPCGFGAVAEYKQVLVFAHGGSVRVRLPLTDVTGKVRVKERTPDGFGVPVAPARTVLGETHYLEWQIGYDLSNTNSPSAAPEIYFRRNGEIKYGHELAKILREAVRLGLLSTNDLAGELEKLKQISGSEFEESRAVRVDVSTNADAAGFQSAVQRLPQFTKTTPYGWVQVQLKQKQRAVGFQAMVYVCLPMSEVRTMDGAPRRPGRAKIKETVYYDFNRANAAFLLDIVHAFGLASQSHNEDVRRILEKILATSQS